MLGAENIEFKHLINSSKLSARYGMLKFGVWAKEEVEKDAVSANLSHSLQPG